MCPEESKIKNNKKLIQAIVITAIILMAGFAFVYLVIFRPVPELQRLKGLEVNYYDIGCYAYNGNTFSSVHKKFNSTDEYNKELPKMLRLMDTRCVKVSDWTPEDITYPIFALKITPVIFKSEKYIHGETFVWSNGYLITSSGEVYKSGLFFGTFLESDENDYIYETEDVTEITDIRVFRPLFMANNMWNPDMLYPSGLNDSSFSEDIEAVVTGITGEENERIVTVNLRNYGEESWSYSNQSLFVRLEVNIGGQWYIIRHDPNVDDDIRTVLGYNQKLGPGEDVDVEFHLGLFGRIPPGNYRIVIWGDKNQNASAEFHKS